MFQWHLSCHISDIFNKQVGNVHPSAIPDCVQNLVVYIVPLLSSDLLMSGLNVLLPKDFGFGCPDMD